MNNEFLKKAAAVMTAATMLGTTAFAAVSIKDSGVTYDSATKQLTVQYDGVDASKQASLLVYNVTQMTAALTADVPSYGDQTTTPIVAIDQTAATGSFSAVLPDGINAGDKLAVKVGATGETTPAAEVFTVPAAGAVAYGDVDNSGVIDAADATYVFARFKGMLADDASPVKDLGVAEFTARADVDGSGVVDAADATYIFAKFKGMLDKFPAEDGPTPSVAPSAGASETPSENPSESTAPEPGVIAGVDTKALAVGTEYSAENPISDTVSVGVAEAGSVSVVADNDKGNVIKLADTGNGSSSLKFKLADAEAPKSGIITFSTSLKLEVNPDDIATDSSILKDTTILRLTNPAYANVVAATKGTDGRFAEITTAVSGNNYQLVYKNYFKYKSETDTANPESIDTTIILKPNTWYDLFFELDTTTNTVKMYATDIDGKVVGSKEITIDPVLTEAVVAANTAIGVTKADIMTKGTQTLETNLYVSDPTFALAEKSIVLPEVDTSDVPWTKGECQDVVTSSTFFNFSEVGSAFDINNIPNSRADFDETVSFGGLTIYMDASRDLEWQDNGAGQGNDGKLEYSTRNKDKTGTVGSLTTSFNYGIGGTYSSLFEGMMLKTADGNSNVYSKKAEDGKVSREIRIRDLEIDYIDKGITVGYDKDGNEVDLTTLTGQEEKLIGPFEKVIGVKVGGPCSIGVISPNNQGRLVTISTADGTVLNPGDFPDGPLVNQGSLPVIDTATGIAYRVAEYTGEEPTEIYISCPAGGVCVYGIEITMVED